MGCPEIENLQPNSRGNVCTAVPQFAEIKADFSGYIPQINISSLTTGSNVVTATVSDAGAVTAYMYVGQLLVWSSTAPAYLRIAPAFGTSTAATRVLSVNGSANSFTVALPYGLTLPSSSACYCIPIVRGDVSAATSDCCDWLQKTQALDFWMEPRIQFKFSDGSRPRMFRHRSSSQVAVYHDPAFPYEGDAALVSPYAGKNVVRGQRVQVFSGSVTFQPFITHGNGTVSSLGGTTTLNATQSAWLEITTLVQAGSTVLQMGLLATPAATGAVWGLVEPMTAFGTSIGDGGAVPYRGQIQMRAEVVPLTLYGAGFTIPSGADADGDFSFAFDYYAETNGAYFDVAELSCAMEFKSAIAGIPLYTKDATSAPTRYALEGWTQVANQMSSTGGMTPWRFVNGLGYIYSTSAGAGKSFFNVSLDLNSALARTDR